MFLTESYFLADWILLSLLLSQKSTLTKRIESDDTSEAAWYASVAFFFLWDLDGSPDLAAAQKVADHIGTIHHEIKFTIQEGLDAIKDVIYNIENL